LDPAWHPMPRTQGGVVDPQEGLRIYSLLNLLLLGQASVEQPRDD
jgi:hypothetical protein